MGWFSKRNTSTDSIRSLVKTDMHSHLIFDVDDGATDLDNSIELISNLHAKGYERLYTTPHVMNDYYRNDKSNLLPKLDTLNDELKKRGIDCPVRVAAEYYIDEWFVKQVEEGYDFLTMGDGYILVETSFLNKPNNFLEVIFSLQTKGYKVILAHPERYTYCYNSFEMYEDLFDRGVFFQVNLNSFVGHYSPMSKKLVEKFLKKGMIHFIGTDCHNMHHIDVLGRVMNSKLYKKLQGVELLNDRLW